MSNSHRLNQCRRCDLPIEKQAVSSSDGQLKGKYHKDCFNCYTCQVSLIHLFMLRFEDVSRNHFLTEHSTCLTASHSVAITTMKRINRYVLLRFADSLLKVPVLFPTLGPDTIPSIYRANSRDVTRSCTSIGRWMDACSASVMPIG